MLLRFCDWLIYDLLRVNPDSRLGGAFHFFVYDSLKILFLLFMMILIIGFVRTYLSQTKIKNWMTQRGGIGNFFAALFGAVTPFCSCSSIPIFFGFLKAGVPLGTTFSFLIASPLINEYLVILMLGFFGWKIASLYVVSGLLMATAAGMVLGRMKLERYLAHDFIDQKDTADDAQKFESLKTRVRFGLDEAVSITKKIWIWVIVGVGIGALIHNYIPQETIQGLISKTGILSVPIAAVLGVPMYGSCAAIVPVAVVLFEKGIPLGTALAFMMAVAALSFPEAIMMRRAMTLHLIAAFFAVTTLAIIITGYLFNFLQAVLI